MKLPDSRLFRGAFLSAGHGMGIVASDGRFVAVNPALCRIVNRSADDLHDLRFQDITHPDDLEADLAKVRQLVAGEIQSYELEKRYLRPDGSSVPIQLNVGIVRGDDGVTHHFIGHVMDLSAHKAALAALAAARDEREAACVSMVETIARAMEKGDPHTAGHQNHTADIAQCIAETLGLPQGMTRGAYIGALLHDIGKVHVPAQILTKPGQLTAQEMALMREHASIGHDILSRADVPWPVALIARQHHERCNGGGYPLGLRGDEICIEARIVAVADVYDAMAEFRPYRAAPGWQAAVAELEGHAGELYDRDVALACAERARHFAQTDVHSKQAQVFHADR